MKTEFDRFSPKVIEFLSELEKNNSKEWFDANRATYEKEIKLKSQLLVEKMAQLFAQNGLSYVADKKKSLFRINRDIRFSKDKSPYKTNMGIYFPYSLIHQNVKDPLSVGLYFHIEPKEIFIAGGMHMPDSNTLLSVRTKIAEEWDSLSKIVSNRIFVKEFPVISFDNMLKTTPKGFPKDHPADKWLRLKDYTAFSLINQDDAWSEKLPELLISKAVALKPFLEFLSLGLDN